MTNWISVEDELPEEAGYVLAIGPGTLPYVSWYGGGKFCTDHLVSVNNTHWMPLPPPPKEQP